MSDLKYFEELGIEPRDGKLTDAQIAKVKSYGCLKDKRYDDVFNVRVITRNGVITSDEQRTISEAADLFGSHKVAMTTRLTIEIQGVRYDDIPSLIMFLRERGLKTGGTGAKVRPVVSCKGTTCKFGLIDTYSLSKKIHEMFFEGCSDVALPHKFKIAVGGCPNNCVKPDLNDFGVIGQRIFIPDLEKCRGCKKCVIEKNCPMKAPSVIDGKVSINSDICNHCGRCTKKCPFGVFDNASEGYKICIGGRWGKKTAMGKPLNKIFTSEDEVLAVAKRALELFRDEGIKGERFSDTVERLGFDYVQKKLIG